jgi:ATP/maltotriose-dependent transcriptional regulator MalT
MKRAVSISKITPPSIPRTLDRPRLIERLAQNQDKKLILILGQAAQGKSTLAVSYVKAAEVPSAWINLGPEDSDPVNFFYLLVHSLQRAAKNINLSPVLLYPSIIKGPRDEIPLYREWLSGLFALISMPLQVIFDGLDRLSAEASAYRFLQVMVEEAPPNIHLIMLSREMPPLEVQALKIRREAFVLTGEELAFTLEETGKFVKTIRQCSCGPELLRRLHQLTEGWIGGLVLLCDYLEQIPENARQECLEDLTEKFKGEIFQFFGERVFASLSGQSQEFLIKSSLFDTVEPDFIRDFLGIDTAQEILDDLAHRNLFVHSIYDKRRGRVFRYHQLFRDFLHSKFQTVVSPEAQLAAYFRAGALFEQRGELEESIKYYLQAGAYPQAVSVIERIGVDLLKAGRKADLYQWLERLPQNSIQGNPWLLFYFCATHRFSGGKEYLLGLQQALTLFQQQDDVRGCLLSLAYLVEASIFRGSLPIPIDSLLTQSEALLQSSGAAWHPYERATLWFQVGFVYPFKFGDPRQGFRACQTAYLLAKEVGDIPLQFNALMHAFSNLTFLGEFSLAKEIDHKIEKLLGNFTYPTEIQALYHILSAQYCIIAGELEKARPLVQEAKEKSETHGLTYLYSLSLLYDQLLKIYLQEYTEAEEVGQRLLHLTSSMGNMYLHGVSLLLLGINYYFKGDPPQKAREVLEGARQILSADETKAVYQMRMLDILMGALASHLEETGPAEQNLKQALDHFSVVSAYFLMSEAHLAMALLKWRQGKIEDTAAHLQAGFRIAGERRLFHYLYLSRSDLVQLCLLALELDVQGVKDYIDQLLTTQLAPQAGPELMKLFHHANPKIAQRAWELGKAIHRTAAPRLRIKTLGGFQVWRGGATLEEKEWEGNQPKLLLKGIVAHGTTGVQREGLWEDLWPEAAPAAGERSFKISLYRLRKALEPALDKIFGSSYVHLKANQIGLDPELCRVDAEEFSSLYKRGTKKEAAGDDKGALSLYKEAAELYDGDFLVEEPYVPWAERRREELRRKYTDLLYRMAGLHERRGTAMAAIDCYKQLIHTDPTWEQAYQRLMILYGNRGMRSAALKVYGECCKALKRELDVEPDHLTGAIYKKILESGQGPTADPPPKLKKFLSGIAIGYLAWPLDLIPDYTPTIGFLDDLVIMSLLMMVVLNMIPKRIAEPGKSPWSKWT